MINATVPTTMKRIKENAKEFTNNIVKDETIFFNRYKLALYALQPIRQYSVKDLPEAALVVHNAINVLDELTKCHKSAQQLAIDRQILGMNNGEYDDIANGLHEAQRYVELWQLACEIEQFFEKIMNEYINLYSHQEGNHL